MPCYICVTCGVQHAESEDPPALCRICEDDRQYVHADGQQWTTLEALQGEYQTIFRAIEPGLIGLTTEPRFAIGQRALLLRSPAGNVLWDCVSLFDEATYNTINALGGLYAIAISHPHFCASVVEFSRAFNHAPIYVHSDDREYVMRLDPAIRFWESETQVIRDGLTLVRCGGHFRGSAVLHWADGAEGAGVLLTSDTLWVTSDRRHVSFMYSYPNLIPLAAPAVRRIAAAVEPLAYDRIYGGWNDAHIADGAKAAVARSVERYLAAISAGA